MARTKRGVISRAKHKKVFKAVKGQYGRRKNTIRVARQAMEKAMQYAYCMDFSIACLATLIVFFLLPH